jgi:hypothetical protein
MKKKLTVSYLLVTVIFLAANNYCANAQVANFKFLPPASIGNNHQFPANSIFRLPLQNRNIQLPPFTDDTQDVPVDGGLSLLVAAGIALGANRNRKKSKNQQQFPLQ